MPRLAEIQDRLATLQAEFDGITAGGEVTPEAAERAAELSGRIAEARDNLVAEAAAVQRENERLAAEAAAHPQEALRDAAELIFGARDAFRGIEPGWSTSVPTADLARATRMVRNAVSGLEVPHRYDYDLPEPIAPVMGFLSTLPHGLTDGHETYYQSPVLTNAAAGWVSGDKPESSLEWTQATAHIETIAHQMPVAKQTVRRYRQLENTIVGALLLGLDIVKNRYAVSGSNSSGIVGARNMTGTLTYTKTAEDKNIRDVAMEMAMRIRLATGFAPNYVVVSPQTLTKARKAKDQNGRYMYPEIVYEGKIDGMTVVEDQEMHIVTSSEVEGQTVTTESDAMGVYFSGGCSWNTADPDEVEIGLVDKQFIQNAYTLLAEGTHALKVTFPAAFCWCASV